MSRFAFLLGCVHCARGSSGRPDASGCDPLIPHDQGRRAHSCQRCGPTRSAGRAGPPQPALSLASTPHRPQDGGEGARRTHCGQPLCPPGRGPPTGSPTRSPRHAGNARSRVSAQRHSRRPQPFYLTPRRRTSLAAGVAGPGSQTATTGLPRAPALLGLGGPSARHALRPCCFSAEDARRSSQSKPSVRMLH